MKRDMELVRKLLFKIEETRFTGRLANPVIEGYDEDTVDHHVYLMMQAGLVHAFEDNTMGGGPFRRAHARELTWEGHDALEVLRSDTVWEKTKAVVTKAGGASIPMLLEVATKFAKKQLGLDE
jgi:hypothetical protein